MAKKGEKSKIGTDWGKAPTPIAPGCLNSATLGITGMGHVIKPSSYRQSAPPDTLSTLLNDSVSIRHIVDIA